MRRSLKSLVSALCNLAMLGGAASSALATTDPILDVYGPSLTVHSTSTSFKQPAWERWQQRGVDIDGTLRQPVPLGWSVAGDPLGGGYSAGRTIGDVNLSTGSYHPTEIDIALPTLGLPVVIGRTYNGVQNDGSGGYFYFEGYQGWNWNQVAQPQITIVGGVTNDLDVIYLHYGNDRFIEFKRSALNSTEFKAKNGAAGAIQFTAGSGAVPELYTYYDQRGNQIVFFGFNGAAAHGNGHLWKMIDPAGHVAYVENASTPATAASNGYDISDRIKNIYDASGRKYLFTYNSFGTTFRLQKVEAQVLVSGTYTTIAKVEYDYYTSTVTGQGKEGDLRLVTTTMKGVSGGDYVRAKLYRYYTNSTWANSDGSRGKQHQLKMVVGFDGIRQADIALSISSHNYSAVTDASLLPYAEAYFEYVSNTDYRLASAIFNGNCGCAGGTSGTYLFSYEAASGYGTNVANTSYDTGWNERTIVTQPDGTFVTQHFDETGAVLGRVVSAASPANWTAGSGSNKTWITDVERNSSGQVTAIHSPANMTAYTHSTGAVTYSSSAGLLTTYTRHAASDNLDGLRDSVAVKEGTAGTASTVSSVSMSDRQLVVGAVGVSTPEVTATATYPSGSALSTSYSYSYYSGTNTNIGYIVPSIVTTTNPIVTAGNNGSNSATAKARYLRADGSTAYSTDESGIIFYSGRTAFGQTAISIADVNSSSGDILTAGTPDNDTASGWSLATSGTGIHAKTTYTYDDQGRVLTQTQPSVSGTRTSTWKYVLDGTELGTFISPLYASSNYYGPLSYSRVNHVGKSDRRATIEIGTPGSTIPTSTTPNTTSGTAWSALADTVYDLSGMRATETRTYLTTSTYDSASIGYDATGRISRSLDATGTIMRTVFDERGQVKERWMGTNDYGWTDPVGSVSGTSNMVKIEAAEYDSNLAMGGGNGYMTKRSQDSSGAWSGGVGDRVTTYAYDYRGRAIVTLPPVAPYSVTKYDNSNRATASAQYSSTSGLTISTDPTASSASTRVALTETSYDERGQVFQSKRWYIQQTGGTAGNKVYSQSTDNWYDADGRLIKSVGQQLSKTVYDRLGRATDRFVIAKVDDTTYAHASGVSGDLVLEQTHMALDPTTGRMLAQWLVQRAHDDTSSGTTGALDTNADSLDQKLTAANLTANARPQVTAMWYDAWDRVSDTVPYGTNGGSTFDRSGLSVPSTGVNTPKTSYAYDGFGRSYRTTDPASKINQITYDFAGRKAQTIDNFVNGTPQTTAGTNGDQDRTTDYVYINGLVTTVTREMPNSGTLHDNDQDTLYEYDTTTGVSSTSIIKAKNILTRVVYPEQTGGQADTSRDVVYIYNALSQVSSTSDPAGNVIATTYDAGGRVTAREATTIAGGFDTQVTRIETSYNARGMTAGVLQKNATPTTLDEVAFDYDGWGNMITFTQDPDSAIGASGRADYAMHWAYSLNSTSGCNRAVYLGTWDQPNGSSGSPLAITLAFGSGIDAYLCRPTSCSDDKSTKMGEYTYLGTNTAVSMDYYESKTGTGTWLYGSGGSSTYNTYMDRFNRPILVKWSPGIGVNPAFINQALDYDVVGNNTTLVDAVLNDASSTPKPAFDFLNTFDDLRRMRIREEGTLSSGSIINRTRIESYARNSAGRITSDKVSLDGDTTYDNGSLSAIAAGDMDDARTYNKRNELTRRDYWDKNYLTSGGRHQVNLTYDLNGNLTGDGEKYTYKYNPWGQLVSIYDTVDAFYAAVYTYNGLGHRISEQTDTNDSGNSGAADKNLTSDDPVFFMAVDPQGRHVATFRNTDTYPKETFIHHPSGLRGPSSPGGIMARDRNASLTDPTKWATQTASSTRGERNYYAANPRGDIIAMFENNGTLSEQYRYSTTGVPFGLPKGNVKSDGVVATGTGAGTDYFIVNAMIGGAYQARGDLNLDGYINSADTAIVTAASSKNSGRGILSVSSVKNCLSFAQMEALAQPATIAFAGAVAFESRLCRVLNSTESNINVVDASRTSTCSSPTPRWSNVFGADEVSTLVSASGGMQPAALPLPVLAALPSCGRESDPGSPCGSICSWGGGAGRTCCGYGPLLPGDTCANFRGLQICCVCDVKYKNVFPFVGGTPALDMILDCIEQHEQQHLPTTCTQKTPGNPLFENCNHCKVIYPEHLQCLQNALASCGRNQACQEAIQWELRRVRGNRAASCAGCPF